MQVLPKSRTMNSSNHSLKNWYFITLSVLVLVLGFSMHPMVVNGYSESNGPHSSAQVTVNAGSSSSAQPFRCTVLVGGCGQNLMFILNAGFGIVGGNPTNEPASYYFTLNDCPAAGGCNSLAAQAIGMQANWVQNAPNNVNAQPVISSGISNYPQFSYTVYNLDVYQRIFQISWNSWQE